MFADVARHARSFDGGDWSLPDIAIGAQMIGWTPEAGELYGRPANWLTIRDLDVRGLLVPVEPEMSRRSPAQVVSLDFDLDSPNSFAAELDEVVSVMGPPHSLCDGPEARWYAPQVRMLFRHAPGHGYTLRMEPMPDAEDEEAHDLTYGTMTSPPYLWRADDPNIQVRGMEWRAPTPLAESFAEIDMMLPDVFASFRRAVDHAPKFVGTPVWVIFPKDDTSRVVQGWFAPDATVIEVGARQSRLGTDRDVALEAARTALGVIRDWGIADTADLVARVFLAGTQRALVAPGLGIALQS